MMSPTPSYRRSASRACAGALTLALCASLAAFAADDNPAAKRDREQLQRTRSALKEATAQRDALQAEKAAWDAERLRLKADASRSQAGERAAAALRKQVAQCEALSQQHTQDLAGLRASLAQAEQQAQEREAALRQQLQSAERLANERAAAVRATAQLLERTTAELRRAENSNGQMHAVALEAIDKLRLAWQSQETLLRDPLGLAAVSHENALVRLREAVEKARATPAP